MIYHFLVYATKTSCSYCYWLVYQIIFQRRFFVLKLKKQVFIMLLKNAVRKLFYPLSKCPGGHPILHRGLKLNSNISAGKYEKN